MIALKNTTTVTQPHISRAVEWLLQSGVQIQSDNRLHHQGFVSWYDSENRTMPYVYSEITGYLANLMCGLYDDVQDERLLASARGAGDWLVRTAHPATGGFRCLYPLQSTRFDYKNSQIYTFDCGVILSGLVNLFRVTREASYLAAGVTVADWLIRDVQQPNGAFLPVYDIDTGRFTASDKEWSLCAGSYHTKVALGLLNLYDVTGSTKYYDAVVRACDFALTFQQPDGRFVSFPSEGGTNSHPHAYSAEGLWVVGRVLGRDDYLQASAKAVDWLLGLQSPEGIIPRHYHNGEALYNERVDILAQTLRLASIHTNEGRLVLTPELQGKLDKLASLILKYQVNSQDPATNGGFYFGRLSDGSMMSHVNVWVTAFAIQALSLYHNREPLNPFFMV